MRQEKISTTLNISVRCRLPTGELEWCTFSVPAGMALGAVAAEIRKEFDVIGFEEFTETPDGMEFVIYGQLWSKKQM